MEDHAFTLDRFDLDYSYRGDCPMCGESIYTDDYTKKLAGELVHLHCAEEAEEELMDWSQE